MKLLIVDDEYYIVQGLVKMVDREALGVEEIYTAYSAEQGRKILDKNPVDLVLVDVEMPKETGLEMLEKMRAENNFTPVIILSGHQRFDYAQQAILYHCFNYLLKPISRQKLNHEISRVLEYERSREGAGRFSDGNKPDQAEKEFVSSVRKYIHEHLGDADLNRAMIADAMHLNPDYLSFCFHRDFDTTLTAYITAERMDQAKYLLRHTKLTVNEIAEQIGIPNISYFYKQFKKATGATPQLYRG